MVAEFERPSKYKGKPVSKKATGKGPGRFITSSGRQRAEEAEIKADVRGDIEEPLVVEAESSNYVSSALGNLLRAEAPKAATEKVGSSKKGSKKKNKKSSTEKATEAENRKEAKAASIVSSQKQKKDLQKRGRSKSRRRNQSPGLEARQRPSAIKDQSGLARKRVDSPPLEKQKPATPHRGRSIGRKQSKSKRAVLPKRRRSIAGDQIPSRREKSAARRSEKNQREKSAVDGSNSAPRSIVAKWKKKATAVPSSSHSASDCDASANKDTGPYQSKGNGSKDSSSRNHKITEGYELVAVRTKEGLLTAGIISKKGASAYTEDRYTQHKIMDGKVGRNTKKSLCSESPFDQPMTSQIEGDVDGRRLYEEKQAQTPAMTWEGLWKGFPQRFTSWSTGEKYPSPQISESPPITIAETSEHGKKAAKILRVHARGRTQHYDRSLPVSSCLVGHKRRDSKNSHPSKNPTPGRSSPTFPSSSGNTHRESKSPFSDGHSITSENAAHAAKQLRNELMSLTLMSLTSAPSGSDEKTVKIENHAWREIVEAAETLDKKFIDVAQDGSNYFFSNNAINEINSALANIRKHASQLNIDEKELIAAARDDDETKLKNILCRESPISPQLKNESQVDGWVEMITSYFDGANCTPDKGNRPYKRYNKESNAGAASVKTFEGRLLGKF